jgi:hypothetical protein
VKAFKSLLEASILTDATVELISNHSKDHPLPKFYIEGGVAPILQEDKIVSMKEYLDGEGMSSTRPSNALLANFNDLMQF